MLSALSVVIRPFELLIEQIQKYLRKKKLKEQLLSTLSPEIEGYVAEFEGLFKTGEERLVPLLDEEPLTPKINQIVRCVADIQIKYAEINNAFIKLAEGCKLISLHEGFMKHLEKADYSLYDFVNMMGRTVQNDHLSIGSDFLVFFRLHRNKTDFKIEGDVDEAIQEMKLYVEKFKRIRRDLRKARSRITRKTMKYFVESRKKMIQSNRRIKIHKKTIADLRQFVRKELLPIVILLEESLPNFKA